MESFFRSPASIFRLSQPIRSRVRPVDGVRTHLIAVVLTPLAVSILPFPERYPYTLRSVFEVGLGRLQFPLCV